MEESSYKHNYEYLSIEEAKAIINGTFVQGITNIGGELATKADIDKLLTAADKKLTSIVPSTGVSNEFVCFFECVDNRVDPTGVHVTNIIIHVGQSQKIKYELTPSNATVDTCTYEVTSGSEFVHITDGIVYADAVGEAVCKITINGTIESTFSINVINGNAERHYGDVFIMQAPLGGDAVFVDFHSPEYCANPNGYYPQGSNYMVYDKCFVSGIDNDIWGARRQIIIDIDQIRKTYKQIKDKPSLIKGKTIEQACSIHDGHYVYVYLYSDSYVIDSYLNTIESLKCRAYKKSSNSSISFDSSIKWVKLNGYTATGDTKNINNLTHGSCIDYFAYNNIDYAPSWYGSINQIRCDYFNRCGTLFSFIMVDLDSYNETSVFDFVSFNDGYFEKGYHLNDSNRENIKEMIVDYTQNSLDITGDYVKLNITINKINNSTDISNLRGNMVAWCFSDGLSKAKEAFYGTDSNGAFFDITDQQTLPYTNQINIPKKDFNKVQLYLSAFNTDDSLIYRSTPIEITL